MTVFCVFCKICRNINASNCRETSATFCGCDKLRLFAIISNGMSAAEILLWMAAAFMSFDDQIRLQRAGLFHCLKNRHNVTRRGTKRV